MGGKQRSKAVAAYRSTVGKSLVWRAMKLRTMGATQATVERYQLAVLYSFFFFF